MTAITREIDQAIVIGESIEISPTDLDRKVVRLLVKGKHVGGPHDGETFCATHELSKNQSISISPLIAVSVMEILGDAVRLGVLAPPHLPVVRKEIYLRRKDPNA
jgi:carbon storage regulator CsrA